MSAAVIVIIIFLVLAIIIGSYFGIAYYKKFWPFKAAVVVPVVVATDPSVTPETPTTDPVSDRDYFYAKSPGSGYVNGMSYDTAGKYCAESGGRLATSNELLIARDNGFELCAYGWVDGSKKAYVMQKVETKGGCPTKPNGMNGPYPADPITGKFGAYCMSKTPPAGVKKY